MKDPKRWLDDPALPEDVRELLAVGEVHPDMLPHDHGRVESFVTRVAAGTVVVSTLFTTKGVAAAFAVSLGVAFVWTTVDHSLDRDEGPSRVVETVPSAPAVAPRGRDGNRAALAAEGASPIEAPAPPPPTELRAATGSDRQAESTEGRVGASTRGTRESESRPRPFLLAHGDRGVSGAAAPRRKSHAETSVASRPHPEDSLAAEAAVLEGARARLGTDPGAALSNAEIHRRLYRNGQLAPERELIAIDALCRLGRIDEARWRAESLMARAPNGMYARRAQRLLRRAADGVGH